MNPPRRRVHVHTAPHGPNTPYWPKGTRLLSTTSTHVYEQADAIEKRRPLRAWEIYLGKLLTRMAPRHRYERARFFVEAHQNGVRVVSGETTPPHANPRKQAAKLQATRRRMNALYAAKTHARKNMINEPSLHRIRDYFTAVTRILKARDTLTTKTILAEKGDASVRLGTDHSLITHLLRKNKLQISRRMSPRQFPFHRIVIRKLYLGKEPTETELFQAYISEWIDEDQRFARAVIGKKQDDWTNGDFIQYGNLLHALIKKIPVDRLKEWTHDIRHSGTLWETVCDFFQIKNDKEKKEWNSVLK